MIDKRTITCTNEDNISVIFGRSFSPFVLTDADGIYGVENDVNTSANTMTDGSTYQGTTVKMRNIVLTMHDKDDHQTNRDLLYNLFKPKSYGTLTYKEGTVEREIKYQVEEIQIEQGRSAKATVSLLCPDPFFTGLKDIVVSMAAWSAEFEWIHEFVDGGEEFGKRMDSRLETIDNRAAADNIGITITINANGAVKNPSVTHVENNQHITLGTTAVPFNMIFGDQVTITTETNNKHVYLERGGVKTEINEYLTEDSEFIQLMHGKNSIGYAADEGVDYMTVSIKFRYRYLGV